MIDNYGGEILISNQYEVGIMLEMINCTVLWNEATKESLIVILGNSEILIEDCEFV